ncbi:MAG TPA: glycosyltransferase [Chryseosolibacter sp.]|nr:glycosyltransferase [Chryseosolibacter sp.]
MATKNGAKYISEQIDSIIMQLGSDDELVISDDRSVDETEKIVSNYHDSRIKFFTNDNKNGVVSNFENSLRRSSGEYIFLSDQDDVWVGNKIEVMRRELLTHDVVISDCSLANDTLDIFEPSFFALNNSGKGIVRNIIKNSYMGCCMAFKRKVLEKALPFPNNTPMHDMWIGLIGEMNYDVKFLKMPLVYYRRHQGNASSSGGVSGIALTRKMFWRITILRNLIANKLYA